MLNTNFEYLEECNLLKENVQIKIGDFGFAKLYADNEGECTTQCGTPLNMAPEIINSQGYDYKVDMWSFGVSIYEALIGTTPFGGKDKQDLKKNVNNGIVRLPSNLNLSNNCLDFLSKCLKIDPKKRFTIDHALNHPFMNPGSP
jgi:serine/threonine protein kinase